MKPVNNIHKTPDEKMAANSEQTISVLRENVENIKENTKAIKDLHAIAKDRSETVDGFIGVIKALHQNNQNINDLKDYIDDPEVVIRKLDEIKSADLATNITLKKIEKNTAREFPVFPKVDIPKVDFSETNKLINSLIEEMKKPCNVKLTLKLK